MGILNFGFAKLFTTAGVFNFRALQTFVFLFACCMALNANAQLNRNNTGGGNGDPYEDKGFFMAGLNYINDNVYLGRKDTFVIPYYTPYLGYKLQNGLYAKALASYTTAGTTGHIDLATIEAGYDHSFGEHFNAGVNAEKFFYNKNSISIKSNTTACIGIDAQYTNGIIEPSMLFDINFNKKSQDYVFGLALDHDFGLAQDKLHIIPAITMNAGTQNYVDEFLTNRANKKDKTANAGHVANNATQFSVLDYEFSAKTTYCAKAWLFTLKPAYIVAENPVIVALPKTKPQLEKLSNSFVVELDICYRH